MSNEWREQTINYYRAVFTPAQIADKLGIELVTVNKNLKGTPPYVKPKKRVVRVGVPEGITEEELEEELRRGRKRGWIEERYDLEPGSVGKYEKARYG